MSRDQAAADRGEHHEVHQVLGAGHAQQFQGAAIGAVAGLAQMRVVPGHQADNQEDRADVEEADPPDDRVGGLDDLVGRVGRFRGRNGDDLGAQEGKHHSQHGHDDRRPAVGHEAAMGREIGDAMYRATLPDVEDCQQADDDEADDGRDLDQREPELELAVVAHVHEVDADQQECGHQGEHVDRDVGEPDVQDHPGHIGFPGHQQGPEPPVQPADGEAGPAADGLVGVGGERAGIGRGGGHLAQHAHDEHDHDAAGQVGQHHGGARGVDDLARAHEQRCTDHAGNRHHREVTGLQGGLELLGIFPLA